MTRRCALVALVCAFAVTAADAAYDFSRYQIILEREPFGSAPKEPAQPPTPAPPVAPPITQSFVRDLRLCAIREKANHIRVGFMNIKEKPEKYYWLYVGETSDDGIEVVDADFVEEKVLLKKDGNEYWLEMGGVATAPAPAPGAPGPGGVRVAGGASGNTGAPPPRTSYLARLRERQEERKNRALQMLAQREQQTEESKAAEEKRLREYNLNLIREGMPALPIPLTDQEDSQLVQEGVLPPSE